MQALADGSLVICCSFLIKVTLSRVVAFMSRRLEPDTFGSRIGVSTNHRKPGFVIPSVCGRSRINFLSEAKSHKLLPVMCGDDACC